MDEETNAEKGQVHCQNLEFKHMSVLPQHYFYLILYLALSSTAQVHAHFLEKEEQSTYIVCYTVLLLDLLV